MIYTFTPNRHDKGYDIHLLGSAKFIDNELSRFNAEKNIRARNLAAREYEAPVKYKAPSKEESDRSFLSKNEVFFKTAYAALRLIRRGRMVNFYDMRAKQMPCSRTTIMKGIELMEVRFKRGGV